ncbi:DUF1553 domain-containing protein [Blastopirellula sp. JC732]|uniref:DUF1553 domain-containing protein n=1 Tax=Blastopirellula sediminis TaxID=2894196 RepID=A0A9X1MNE1_9BACT|nr:DUF1553 domain-containing protein [Blastopirellula sediminis]MCC9607322.1 DUF1553 domain-containing protein [Blastopirellula sediminis]MCC9629385.1 DUF1553 domain-containing protein [Blastopirellula sediminis]
MKHRTLLLLFSLLTCGVYVSASVGDEPIPNHERQFFEEKIRPLLVAHCYKCHSAAAKEVGGKLLLDSRDGMMRGGESGPSVVPGDPDASLLLDALHYETFEMPPDKPLPEADVRVIAEWIKRGAWDPRGTAASPEVQTKWKPEELWSFQTRHAATPPNVETSAWPQSDIDRFILHRIEAAAARPTADADLRTLAIRLHYDLIGLPPSVDEIDDFVQAAEKDRATATAAFVDNLLARPQFGEHWGRHWLDVARYGESNGNDGLSRNATFPHAWRYRDYVIDALNRDIPYDRFLTEQLAGDLLPATTADERNRLLVATGFLAIGSKPAVAMNSDFAMDIVDDQINVVSTAFLGLSVACARCHDHKHDPIPTSDYYALAGIFQSSETLYGLAANEKLTAPPTELHILSSQLPEDDAQAEQRRGPLQLPAAYQETVQQLQPEIHVSLDQLPEGWEKVGEPSFSAEQFATLKESYVQSAAASAAADYSVSFWFKNDLDNLARPITAYLFTRGKPGDKQIPGDHLGIGGKHEPTRSGRLFVFNGNQKKTSIGGSTVIPVGTWNHVVLTRKGKRVRVYLNGANAPEIDADIDPTFGEEARFSLGGRSDNFAPLQGNLAHFSWFSKSLTAAEAQSLHDASGQPRGAQQLGLAMGVRDKAKPSDCKIHINGLGAKLGAVVPRGALTSYHVAQTSGESTSQLPDLNVPDAASGRLELAAWLTDPRHPQTSRVMVNRVWLNLMGEGLVATPDDFGVYGARPTHPELLDWLADDFIRDGWSLKRLIRTIVLSRTYQLSSQYDEHVAAADPANALYTRFRQRRLSAEQLRDSILQASGALDLQPAAGSPIQEIDALINMPPHEASTLHQPSDHRSVYLCMMRNAPPPELAAFDLPTGLKTTGRRSQTVLPAQSLFLLNSPFVTEQAKRLAEHVSADSNASDEAKITLAFQRTLLRNPTSAELTAALKFLAEASNASQPSDSSADTLSRWGAFCQSLLASSEFRYID